MKKLLDIAKECGADVQQEVNTSDKVYNLINVLNITEAQLIATLESWNRQNSEPIYQIYGQFGWLHTLKEYFDTETDESSKRIVYLAPPQPQTVKDALEKAASICESMVLYTGWDMAKEIRTLIDQARSAK